MVEGFLSKFATGVGQNWKRRYFRLYAAARSQSIPSLNLAAKAKATVYTNSKSERRELVWVRLPSREPSPEPTWKRVLWVAGIGTASSSTTMMPTPSNQKAAFNCSIRFGSS